VRAQLYDILHRHGWTYLLLAVAVVIALVVTAIRLGGDDARATATAPIATTQPVAPRAPAAPVLPEPSDRVEVRVTHAGALVADAVVFVEDGSGRPATVAHTDAAGRAELPALVPGAYELWAMHESFASPVARIAATPSAPIELALEPGGRIRGEVIVDNALPPGATLELVPLGLDHVPRIAALDELGLFAVDAVPPGRWRIEATVPGYVLEDEAVIDVDTREASVVLRMQRAGGATGIVVDESGQPIANATVLLREQHRGAMQAEDLAHPPTGVKPSFVIAPSGVRWIHPLASRRLMPVLSSARYGAGRSGPRPPECGRGHCGVDLGEEQGSTVHAAADGVVSALFPEPRTEAGRVVVIHHGRGLKSLYMHLDAIRPGLEVGQQVRAGDSVGTLGTSGILRSMPHLHFAITYERFGRTWYLDPEPVLRNAVVLAEQRTLDPIVPTAPATRAEVQPSESPVVEPTLVTDDKGMFSLDGFAAGTYVAVAFAPDNPPAASSPFEIRTGEQASGITIVVRPGAMVVGRVVGRDGPIAGATVIAGAGLGETAHKVATTTTDRDGEFKLRAITGTIVLSASASGYGEAARTIVVDDRASAVRRENFMLTIENAELRGQVIAPDGGAAAGVAVRVVEGTTRRRAVTDAQGRFALLPLASGRYVLELTSPEFPTKRVSTQSDRFTEIKLEAGGGIRLAVRSAQGGEPIVGARVDLVGPADRRVTRTADARGGLDVRGLAAGEWEVVVRAPGYVAVGRKLAVKTGTPRDEVVIELPRGSTIAGVVRDRYGRRVADARVTLGTVSTRSDADGEFQLTGVASGTLEVEHAGRQTSHELQLSPGEERRSLSIELAQ
jgi:murein DD-endopeptidase MepM/ murein hydrolase activator NlpD